MCRKHKGGEVGNDKMVSGPLGAEAQGRAMEQLICTDSPLPVCRKEMIDPDCTPLSISAPPTAVSD
eukprot:1821239-Rhodomonas_salina.2